MDLRKEAAIKRWITPINKIIKGLEMDKIEVEKGVKKVNDNTQTCDVMGDQNRKGKGSVTIERENFEHHSVSNCNNNTREGDREREEIK